MSLHRVCQLPFLESTRHPPDVLNDFRWAQPKESMAAHLRVTSPCTREYGENTSAGMNPGVATAAPFANFAES